MMGIIKKALGISPPPETPNDERLDKELTVAVERNKNAATNLQTAAFRQMSNAELVRITVKTVISRIENNRGQKDEATCQD